MDTPTWFQHMAAQMTLQHKESPPTPATFCLDPAGNRANEFRIYAISEVGPEVWVKAEVVKFPKRRHSVKCERIQRKCIPGRKSRQKSESLELFDLCERRSRELQCQSKGWSSVLVKCLPFLQSPPHNEIIYRRKDASANSPPVD
ncbi:hypothetical protein K469DRAFT_747985 [Zopfia rhizophila CBS 207.26]|uniref:Uncharacterized protein n=1 Tax=Zopfia rhizophila CBS 207.26 TaxID=1314779 RepID=A0A6A6EHD7_9PEZI|nr:hypothetical protein K469DRAFT_747985 [Zopfia rhizophila CBS 207.26]